jgi:hypothetical protein
MNKQIEIYSRLHGTNKHTCQHPGCQTMVMGAYCMVHNETEIAQEWEHVNDTAEGSAPTGETE